MSDQRKIEELQRQVEQLQAAIDELRAWYTGLERHLIRATATLNVVVELEKGR